MDTRKCLKESGNHCHMKVRQRKEYGVDISTKYMERDQKLEITIVRWTWMSLMN